MNKSQKDKTCWKEDTLSCPIVTNKTETPSKKKHIINSSAEQVILCFWGLQEKIFAF